MSPITIVIGEDHSLVREGIKRILGEFNDFQIVGEASNGQSFLELIKSKKPEIAIIDIRMPILNGVEVLQDLKKTGTNTRGLILTAFADDEYILDAMEAGAAGYLLKSVEPNELAEAIRTVHQGESVLDPKISLRLARIWNEKRRGNIKKTIGIESLSTREVEVLKLAIKGLRNKDIGVDLNISVRTVEGHFNSKFNKLGVSSKIEAVLLGVAFWHNTSVEK